MTTADTDEDDNDQLEDVQGDQPAGAQNQTDEDTLDQRLPEDAETANDDKDESAEVQDPILLAQMDDEQPKQPTDAKPTGDAKSTKPKQQPPKAEEPKAKPNKAPPKTEATENQKPDDDQQAADADLKAATERLPSDDWKSLSHKGKSQVLAMQRLVRTSQAAVERSKAEAAEQTSAYQKVERLRQHHGLEPEEFVSALSLGGAIKSGRKEVIQYLETTLDALRKHHGVEVATPEPEVRVESLGIDPDELEKLANAAENFDLDAVAKLKQMAANAKAAKGKLSQQPPPKQQTQPQQKPQPKADDRQQPSQKNAEQAEFEAIGDALEALGVNPDQMEGHVVQLIKDITGGDSSKLPPPGKRLRALVEAHNKRAQAAKPPSVQRPPVTPPPLSGRTGARTQGAGSTPTTSVDPLKIAFRT